MPLQQAIDEYTKEDVSSSNISTNYNEASSSVRPIPMNNNNVTTITIIQGETINNEEPVFRIINIENSIQVDNITIKQTKSKEEEQVEKAFHRAVVIATLSFFTGLTFLSCLPFLSLIKYRKSDYQRARDYGQLSMIIFKILFSINVVICVCIFIPLILVLVIWGIIASRLTAKL
ncbi:hypothetical protein ABK040_003760 [Willaertia magna]